MQGILCDLLWSDPQDGPGRNASKRGTGCMFGPDVVNPPPPSSAIIYIDTYNIPRMNNIISFT